MNFPSGLGPKFLPSISPNFYHLLRSSSFPRFPCSSLIHHPTISLRTVKQRLADFKSMATEKSVMAVIRAARPSFRNDNDKVAFAVHATFLASGFVLTAAGPPALSDSAFHSSSTEEVGIERWNELEDDYAFVYVSPEENPSARRVLVKCLVMNDKLLVDAVTDQGLEPVHLEINVREYVKEDRGSNFSAQYKNLEKLVAHLDSQILTKIDGSSQKKLSSNPSSSQSGERSTSDVNESPRGPYIHRAVIPPMFPSGSDDLFPGPGAGMYPGRPGFGGGGSMLIGPDDPRWFGGIGRGPGFPGVPPGVPPGARFDPIGPPDIPGFGPNPYPRNPRRPGDGTHPDLEFFRNGSDYI